MTATCEPADSPLLKKRAHNPWREVVAHDRNARTQAIARRHAEGHVARRWCRPYADPKVIAGQGTRGAGKFARTRRARRDAGHCRAPVSRRGLIAGVATASKRVSQAMVMSAEPNGFDDHARSLRAA